MFPVTYTYKNLNSKDKAFLSDYVAKKIDRIAALLKRYKTEDTRLEIKAETFATKAACKVELILHLPRQIIRANEDDHTIIEATDLAVDKLIIQLRKLVNKK